MRPRRSGRRWSRPYARFSSGGTEANNQALRSARGAVVVSAVEHDSVLAAVPDALRVPVDAEGRLDLGALEQVLARLAPELVSVMLANNETGVIQPVCEVAEIARRDGARVHCDAVQAGGKLPIDMAALGVDFLTLSAHKFGGPQGVGALVVRDGLEPDALLRGGGQERRWRPGTENLPGIVGFGRACELAMADADWRERTGALRDRLEARIAALAPLARVFGRSTERLPNTSCLTMPGVSNQTQLIELDLAGIAISTGAAGIRVGVKTAGCSGLTYTIDFAREIGPGEEVIEADGVKVVIDSKATMYLLGTEMDFVEDRLGAAFKFSNPNEAGRCGCGESFTV